VAGGGGGTALGLVVAGGGEDGSVGEVVRLVSESHAVRLRLMTAAQSVDLIMIFSSFLIIFGQLVRKITG
jgi:hypothetical protein